LRRARRTNDRRLHAFDAASGKLLWEVPTNSGILAPPASFLIDGKQYIAVESGWGGDSRGMNAALSAGPERRNTASGD
jgi:alcohol dehydrogenase (cytochrome c)